MSSYSKIGPVSEYYSELGRAYRDCLEGYSSQYEACVTHVDGVIQISRECMHNAAESHANCLHNAFREVRSENP